MSALSDGEILLPMVPQCAICANRYGGTDECAAFPQGIPRELSLNIADHRKPYPGDKGVRFKLSLRPSMGVGA